MYKIKKKSPHLPCISKESMLFLLGTFFLGFTFMYKYRFAIWMNRRRHRKIKKGIQPAYVRGPLKDKKQRIPIKNGYLTQFCRLLKKKKKINKRNKRRKTRISSDVWQQTDVDSLLNRLKVRIHVYIYIYWQTAVCNSTTNEIHTCSNSPVTRLFLLLLFYFFHLFLYIYRVKKVQRKN